jgi:hypothetical protein
MGLYLLIPTFVVIVVSVMIVRAGAVALSMTGLDKKTADFQALSAFTRAGFTTKESELVVSHPQRRAIVTWLIILGNAGIVAVIVTGTSSLASSKDYRLAINIAVLAVGLYVIYRLARHSGFSKRWEDLIENRLLRGKAFGGTNVEHLLHLPDGYGVARATITEKSTLVNGTLKDAQFPTDDFSILGIERRGKWIPSPTSDEQIDGRDSFVVFGRLDGIEDFFAKTTGAVR